MDTPRRKEALLLIHNEWLSYFQKLHSVPWAMRAASLCSSFGNKSYCELLITPNSALLTHSVPSWNHSPQNEYKGDSCRADDGQVWIMRPVIHFLTSWQRWRTASPCSCGRCAPYRSQQSVPCSDRRRGSWRPLESHYCPWTEADCSWHCNALYKHRPGRGVTANMIHS